MSNRNTKPEQPQTSRFFHVTFFEDAKATTFSRGRFCLSELHAIIPGVVAPIKKKLPWLKLARFSNKPTPDGCLRHNDNVVAITGIELDYDGEQISFKDAVRTLRRLGCRALIYTSPSHSGIKPRWRVLMPTSQELPPDYRKVLVRRVDGWFGGIFAPESYTLSQAYYYGRVKGGVHQCELINTDGDFVDLREDLTKFDEPDPVPIPPDILAMLLQDVGKGVSIAPEDNRRQETPEQLEMKITCALAVVPSDDYWTWLRLGAAIHDGLGDAGFRVFEEWSQESAKYNARACQRKWQECAKMRSIRVSTIFWEADQQDSRWREVYRRIQSGEVLV